MADQPPTPDPVHRVGRERDERRRVERLIEAQSLASELFDIVEREGVIVAGITEAEASRRIAAIAADRFGVANHWHKRIVRSGPNTLATYRADPPDRVIEADDIVFGDFGPIFDGWEADFGRTWVIGDDPVKLRLRDDLEAIFDLGVAFANTRADVTGAELYGYVVGEALRRGWTFGNFHCGHLVGEFPHDDLESSHPHAHLAASNDAPLRCLDPAGLAAHWILEIHLVDEALEIGGFFEQLLPLEQTTLYP